MQPGRKLVGLPGEDAARGDSIDADIVRRPISGEVAGKTDERGFDDRVSDGLNRLLVFGHAFLAVKALVRGDHSQIRCHVEDDTRVAPDHLLSEDARAQKGSGETDGDVGVPSLEREVFESRPGLAGLLVLDFGIVGRVVDKNVDTAEFGDDGVAGFEQQRFACNVDGKAKALWTVDQLELLGKHGRVCDREIEENDVCPGGSEDVRVMVAEKASSSSHNSNTASEIEEIEDAALWSGHT